MLKTNRLYIALILATLTSIVYFILQKDSIRKTDKQMLDTLNYNESDYDLMIAYYSSDTTFKKMLHEKIETGDSSATQVNRLLHTPYHLRHRSGLKESDINGMIYSFYISKEVLDKFANIDKQLK